MCQICETNGNNYNNFPKILLENATTTNVLSLYTTATQVIPPVSVSVYVFRFNRMSFSRRIMRVCGAGAAAAAGLVALAATHGGRREEGEANILRKWQLQAKTKIPQHGVYHGTGSKWDSDWDRYDC